MAPFFTKDEACEKLHKFFEKSNYLLIVCISMLYTEKSVLCVFADPVTYCLQQTPPQQIWMKSSWNYKCICRIILFLLKCSQYGTPVHQLLSINDSMACFGYMHYWHRKTKQNSSQYPYSSCTSTHATSS